MSRLRFPKERQKEFLNKTKESTDLNWNQIASICKIHHRTLIDWRREKYQMNYEALKRLCKATNVLFPKDIEVLPEYWNTKKAGSIGAIRRYKLYGNPGTAEGRSKGGKTTQRKFNLNPKQARKIGFKIRKEIKRPEKSSLLAEFIGIILGDGTIARHQIKIYVNSKTDRAYAYYIRRIIKELFGISASINFERKNTLSIVVSSKNLVEFLLEYGLKHGNKILQQTNVPNWILAQKKLMRACLRGLIDTDGSIYFHTHITKGIKYRHIGLNFTSLSLPLLDSVHQMLLAFGIAAKSDRKRHVSVYNRDEIIKYMKEIGSHNKKHIIRFKSYRGSKFFK